MRTTIEIDDDLLAAARELARLERTTAGRVVSRLLRKSLTGAGASTPSPDADGARRSVAGFRPFASRGNVITNDEVNALRDVEGI